MKTSIFDATFTLPPLIEMTEVEKDMVGVFSDACTLDPACLTVLLLPAVRRTT